MSFFPLFDEEKDTLLKYAEKTLNFFFDRYNLAWTPSLEVDILDGENAYMNSMYVHHRNVIVLNAATLNYFITDTEGFMVIWRTVKCAFAYALCMTFSSVRYVKETCDLLDEMMCGCHPSFDQRTDTLSSYGKKCLDFLLHCHNEKYGTWIPGIRCDAKLGKEIVAVYDKNSNSVVLNPLLMEPYAKRGGERYIMDTVAHEFAHSIVEIFHGGRDNFDWSYSDTCGHGPLWSHICRVLETISAGCLPLCSITRYDVRYMAQ